MKTHAYLAAAALSSLAFAVPAAAETSGARVEAVIGLDQANLDSFGNQDDPSETGTVYGLGIGYDFPISGGLSIGVDLEATDSSAEFNFVSGPDNNSFQLGRDLYAGARVTTALSQNVNLYFKAGYTNLHTRTDLINATFPLIIETNRGGARAGAGLQFNVGGGAYVGGEYRFSTYDELDRHQGVATLGYRF
jgi:outer membrane immunogenic protein